MVWTLPPTNDHNTAKKLFNNSHPCFNNVVNKELMKKNNEQQKKKINIIKLPPKKFAQKMSKELHDLMKDSVNMINNDQYDLNQFHNILMKNNRLTFVGFAIVFSCIIVWILFKKFE